MHFFICANFLFKTKNCRKSKTLSFLFSFLFFGVVILVEKYETGEFFISLGVMPCVESLPRGISIFIYFSYICIHNIITESCGPTLFSKIKSGKQLILNFEDKWEETWEKSKNFVSCRGSLCISDAIEQWQ